VTNEFIMLAPEECIQQAYSADTVDCIGINTLLYFVYDSSNKELNMQLFLFLSLNRHRQRRCSAKFF
jgi:hypothetical protein